MFNLGNTGSGGNMFGSTGGNNNANSSFTLPGSNTTGQSTTGNNMFGGGNTANTGLNTTGGGMFSLGGNTTTGNTTNTGSTGVNMFSTNATNNTSTTGGMNLGQNTLSAPKQTTFVGPHSKFAELPDATKKKLIQFETALRAQGRLRDEVAEMIEHTVQRNEGRTIESLTQKLSSLTSAIQRDKDSLAQVYERVAGEIKESERGARQVRKPVMAHENVYLPSQFHWRKLDSFQARVAQIQKQIDDIDDYLVSSSQSQPGVDPQVLQEILKRQHDSLYSVAGRIAASHAGANKQRSRLKDYLRYKRSTEQSSTDNEALGYEDIENLFKYRTEKTYKPYRAQQQQQQQQQRQQQQQQQQQGNNMFGMNNNQASTNMFGSTGGNTGGGNMFALGGNTNTNTTGGGNNMFSLGGNTNTSTTTGSSMFGNTSTTGGGNMFGGNTNTSTTGGNMFGGNTNTSTTGAGNNMFGGNTSTTGGNMFGNTATTGGNMFG